MHAPVVRSLLVLALAACASVFAQVDAGAAAAVPSGKAPCTAKMISAHEGNHANTSRDTLVSQRRAFRVGDTIADSDLWVTKDGYIVQMHDDDVSHSTDGQGLVQDLTLDQIKQLRTKVYGLPVPTLPESLALRMATRTGRYLMFETKWIFHNETNLTTLANNITAAGMTDHVIIYSSSYWQLNELKQIDPSIITWYKATGTPDPGQFPGMNGVMVPASLLTPDVVTMYHEAGLTVIRERGADNTGGWHRFLKSGADGLMTDHATRMARLCKALG